MAIRRYSYWWDNSHPDFAYQANLPSKADIVIIGAGFAGISTALWALKLSRGDSKPLSILLVDSSQYPGFKSSGRMNGSIYLGSNKNASKLLEKISEEKLYQLYSYSAKNNALIAEVMPSFNCDLEMAGGIRMASSDLDTKHLGITKGLLDRWGHTSLIFNHERTQSIAITPLIKSSLYIALEGIFDPFKYVNSAARFLRQQGVAITYGARVVECGNDKNGAYVKLENGHVVHAKNVVHTVADSCPSDKIKENILYRRETVIRTNPIAEELDEMPLPLMPIELHGGLDSARIHERSVIMTGGKSALRQCDPDLMVRDDSAVNRKIVDSLDSTMMRNFPFSNHTDVSHVWTYIETESSDGLPIAGEIPDFPGHYITTAYGRNKFGLAFLSAKNIAEKTLRIKSEETEFNIFTPTRLI